MRAISAVAVLVAALTGCAAKHPPFAVTWYIVYERVPSSVTDAKSEQQKQLTTAGGVDGAAGAPDKSASAPAGSNHIVLAVLNQSAVQCEVDEIQLNGEVALRFPKLARLERGEILLVRPRDFKNELKTCVVPVSVEIHGSCKVRTQLLGPVKNPVVPLPAAFPSSLPETWLDDADCTRANPPKPRQ